MNFADLLDGAEILAQGGNPCVTGVEYDSRRVKPGSVFVAMRGETSDGNCFIDQAIAAGAAAVVTDSDRQPASVAWAKVPHGRRALAVRDRESGVRTMTFFGCQRQERKRTCPVFAI